MLHSIFESATKEGFGGWKMEETQAEVAKGVGREGGRAIKQLTLLLLLVLFWSWKGISIRF